MRDNLFKDLKNFYPVSKTLRFELKPMGKTLEHIELSQLLETDDKRASEYIKVKGLIDEYHKLYISEQLSNFELIGLEDYYELFIKSNRDDKEEKNKERLEDSFRKQIANQLTSSEKYKDLSKAKLIDEFLVNYLEEQKRFEELDMLKMFKNFTTYFTGFFKNRSHIYSNEEKSGTLSYRLINENLPFFINNMKIFKLIQKSITELNLNEGEINLLTNNRSLESIFEVTNFNHVLTQKGIEQYNLLITGYKEEEKQIEGLNNYINKYNQQVDRSKRIPKLNVLYNQVLASHQSFSFSLDSFNNDGELMESIIAYHHKIMQFCFHEEKEIVGELYRRVEEFDLNKIYINSKSLSSFSNLIFKDWSILPKVCELLYDENNLKDKQKISVSYLEKRAASLKKIEMYSFFELLNGLKDFNFELVESFLDYFRKINENHDYFKELSDKFEKIDQLFVTINPLEKKLLLQEDNIEIIKQYLDELKAYQQFVFSLIPINKSFEMDMNFYSEILTIGQILEIVSIIYDKSRNYLTQKPFSTSKMKLNFDNPTLLDGWDVNKENDNSGIIFEKDGLYYLGLYKKGNRNLFNKDLPEDEDYFRKMDYKLLPGPNKMLPKVFFSNSRRDEFGVDDTLYRKYKEKKHIKSNEDFDLHFCHELIDFYKKAINQHEDWKKFNFIFSDTSTYKDISEFYKEVEKQGYKIEFRNISKKYLMNLVDEDKMYLFQIYNKDFSEFSKGSPNLHTIYWKALFDENNLKDVIYKLNGSSEIFYRKASLPTIVATHPANENIKNKNKLNNKENSIFDFDLIKDKRYRTDKFFFHVPITMNFKAKNQYNINEYVNSSLKNSDDFHVIGVDRGERNLIYVSVIDKNGDIVKQESLNTIISSVRGKNASKEETFVTDYQQLLSDREKKRDLAKKSWKTIENIKELKEGYISQVVNRIVELMFDYNAIVVLEDLNLGFKNSRIKVDRQVYQKFEKQLISKLNYLVIKNKEFGEGGHYLNPLQLANQFESFKKLGKQTGVLFYIPAWKTSKIDPITGFVDEIRPKYENKEKAQNFIDTFVDIIFNEKDGYYEFLIDDYSKFTNRSFGIKKDWVLCSYGNRIETFRDKESNNNWNTKEIDLTKQFDLLFETYNVDKNNLKSSILEIDEPQFYMEFIKLVKLLLQMRNSVPHSEIDYLISPVKDKFGKVFDSRKEDVKYPIDADANGAYNIARKGLMLVEQIKTNDSNEKMKWRLSNLDYLTYVQEKHWK